MRPLTIFLIIPGLAVLIVGCVPEAPPPTPTTAPTRIPIATSGVTAAPTFTSPPIVLYTVTPTIEPPPTRTPSPTPGPTLPLTPSATFHVGNLPSTQCKGSIIGPDVLVNGGFEGGQHTQEVAEIGVPDSWTAFWQQEGTPTLYDPQNHAGYQRPETGVINNQPPYDNPPRVSEGARAFRMMGNERAFDAGIWQQVRVSAGTLYCLTGIAHAWSSRTGENLFQSTLDIADDQRNANFLLGIDPTGGSNPWSGAIQWGSVVHNYDHYQPMYTVQVNALNPTITVFVRGYMLWRFSHNEMYFDDMTLYPLSP